MGISKHLTSIERYEKKTESLIGRATPDAIDRRREFAKQLRSKMTRRHNKNLFADGLRNRMTKAEKMLSEELEKYRIHKCYFRSQHVVMGYIPDFLFPKSKLIVELDGSVHDGREEYDARRDAALEGAGYTVIRFRNEEIYRNCSQIAEQISEMVKTMNRSHWKAESSHGR
jgi:very-short-patch-repair endonuclease